MCVTVFVYVSVYPHISSPLPSARTLTGECIQIGGLPKQRVSYSQGRDMQTGSDNLSIIHTKVMDP